MRANCLVIIFCVLGFIAGAQDIPARASQDYSLSLDFTLVDLPYALYASNLQAGLPGDTSVPRSFGPNAALASPSMSQAMDLSAAFQRTLFFGVRAAVNAVPFLRGDAFFTRMLNGAAQATLSSIGDFFLILVPFGRGWMHEEFHRAVLTRADVYGNNTFNDIFSGRDIGAEVYSVDSILDADLERMKAWSNPDFVRMHAAGFEGEVLFGEKAQRSNFFDGTDYLSSVSYLLSFGLPTMYMLQCADKEAAASGTIEVMAWEGSNQSYRDFTGMDFTAWAYDLHNPLLPYSARGQNPHGAGYDRYIYGDKLTDAQYGWIRKEAYLSLLNLVSPMLVFINSMHIAKLPDGTSLYGNFSLRYYPTSFGSQIGLNLLCKAGPYKAFVNLALNRNAVAAFPSLEAALVDFPVLLGLSLSLRGILWAQPRAQAFDSVSSDAGGLLGLKIEYAQGNFPRPFLDMELKSAGWVAGNVFLGKDFSVKAGLSLRL